MKQIKHHSDQQMAHPEELGALVEVLKSGLTVFSSIAMLRDLLLGVKDRVHGITET